MNKVILGLILAVCVLGMALVMLNERLGRKSEPPSPPAVAETRQPEYKQPATGVVQPVEKQNTLVPLPTVSESAESATPPRQQPAPVQMAEAPTPPPAPAPAPTPAPVQPEKPAAPEPPRQVQATRPQPAPAPETRKPEPAPAPKPAPATTVKPAPVKDSPQGNTITRFVVFSRDKGATVRIGGNGRMGYRQMLLENPHRMVIDLDGDWQFPANPGIPKNDLVSNVRVGKIDDKTRVVIDLKAKPRIARVLPGKGGDSLDVRVDR